MRVLPCCLRPCACSQPCQAQALPRPPTCCIAPHPTHPVTVLAPPPQMAPYREALSRLLAGRELGGPPFYLLTYASLAAFFWVAMHSGSIWVPLQFVGATAGALIAFIFPAWVALAVVRLRDPAALASHVRREAHAQLCCHSFLSGIYVKCSVLLPSVSSPPFRARPSTAPSRPQAYWRWNAWALIAIGVVQAAAGIATTLFFQPPDHNGVSSGVRALAYLS